VIRGVPALRCLCGMMTCIRKSMRRGLAWAGAAGVASVAFGQVPPTHDHTSPTSAIVGTVFDSLTKRPLGGAHVHLADQGRDVVSDTSGAFRFDGVNAGVHSLWADHPEIDRLGLYSLRTTVETTSSTSVVTAVIAVPSFATL